MAEQRKKLRLGELLVQQGLITPDQLGIALAEQKGNNIPIGRQLVRLGFITEAAIRDIMARTVGQESIDLAQVVADPEALRLVPQDFARRHRVLPIAYDADERQLTIATTEIFNVVALDQLRASLGAGIEIKTQLAGEAQLEDYFDQFYGYELSVDGILQEIETGEIDYQSLGSGGDEYTQPMVRLVNALLVDAVKRGSSDIHFEPEYAFLRIRYRIDGVLETVRSLHKTYMPGITVRIKVISEMNIAETRAPQDGRISLTLNGRPIDFRVSTHPTVHGENIVLRILDREKSIISLDKMNLPAETMSRLDLMMARPEGILIVTGPTGSGKTTTLYSLLSQLNDEAVNIMTLEDPVEYPLTLMRQTSVNEAVKMDFANGIRSMMRQDPDIILVGEIRDHETAEMAFRAAMTGHQVFSTLHSNSALGAFPRLLDIGIQPDIMAGNIIGVVAQRLVRALCVHCKEAYLPTPEERRVLDRQQLCTTLGISVPALESSNDALYLHLLGLRAPENNLAPATVTASFRQRQMRRGVYMLTALTTLTLAAWCAVNLYQIVDTRLDIDNAKKQTADLQAQYLAATREFPAAPASADNLQRAVELSQKIGATTRSPERMMELVSEVLEENPAIYMRLFGWKYDRTEITVDGAATRSATPAAAPAPNAPPPPPGTDGRKQSALIEGEVRPFRGDYRAAIDSIKTFAGTIAKRPEVAEVKVVKMPLDINPALSLSGNTTENRDQIGKAEFKLVIVFKQSV